MLNHRKKRPLIRTTGTLRDARLIVVATEGEKTEESYLKSLEGFRVKIRVLNCTDGKSAPEYVLQRMEDFCREYQIGGDDQLWLALDVDRWGDKKLSGIASECGRKNIFLAISNPCFEIWLAFHLEDDPLIYLNSESKCSDVVQFIREKLGSYSKAGPLPEEIFSGIERAIERAKQNSKSSQRWPGPALGSDVFKLIQEIRALA